VYELYGLAGDEIATVEAAFSVGHIASDSWGDEWDHRGRQCQHELVRELVVECVVHPVEAAAGLECGSMQAPALAKKHAPSAASEVLR